MKSRVVVMDRPGGPEVLRVEEREVGAPSAGQVLIRQAAAGVNYIDLQHRTGRYPLPSYPAVIGMEAAGVVEEVGPGATSCKRGDRVAYTTPPPGGYAEWRIMPADRLVPVPAGLDMVLVASSILRGLTAHYLIKGTFEVARGHIIVVHAAAGGVGQIVCQWAKHLGATVIGTVGADEKIALARGFGCDHVIVNESEDLAARVKAITGGRGADVVYDSIGPATFDKSLACLKPRGLLVSFGTSSGPLPPFDIFRLNHMGSLYVTSAGLLTYTTDRDELLMRAKEYFEALQTGIVKLAVRHRYPLTEAAQAHRDMAARKTTGAIALTW
ncbi:MAG: quinone oxidoreductase [Betaproteobacteria bacterium]|nr:quinone oxidoreductase [Betaproteobacteria bacterium]